MISNLIASILVLQPTTANHEFVFVADRTLKSVSVAGSFNNWDKMAMPMSVADDGRTWRRQVKVPIGKHHYKFVIDNDTWITDPQAAKNEDDGNGNTNSVLLVLPPDYTTPAAFGDGKVTTSAIQHRQVVPDLNFDRGKLTVAVTVRPGDVEEVYVVAGNRKSLLVTVRADEFSEVRRGELLWDRKSPLEYSFEFKDGAQTLRLGPGGIGPSTDTPFRLDPKTFKPFEVPQWVAKTVFYQIFPERFDNGSKSNDPKDVIPWNGEPKYFNFMGGDLAGVSKRVDYLKGLGVSGIYFNPIFKSPSNHGYETSDYQLVEPRFGTNKEFAELVKTLRKNGIRTVLDGVFNHTAVDFAPFADIRTNGQSSKFRDWYFIKSFPVVVQENPTYEAWYGFPSMPKLNVLNPDVESYLLSVLDFWQKEVGLDGWRLDVANEVDERFWRKFRTHLKSKIGSDQWILGEVWGDGSRWLQGDQWDSVMNYQFRDATLRYIARNQSSPADYMSRLMSTYESYAPQVSRNLLNLISSHDTPRFIHECGGDRRLAMLGATLLMTWVGAPSIYYGDEVGMEGGVDPDNRRGMRWDLATDKNDILAHYKLLAQVRNSNPALQDGDPVPMTSVQMNALVFGRVKENSAAIVAVNRTDTPRTVTVEIPAKMRRPLGTKLVDALTNEAINVLPDSKFSISLAPFSSMVIVPAGSASRPVRNPLVVKPS